MSVTPESVKQMLSSEDLGDRLRAVQSNTRTGTTIAFELSKAINEQCSGPLSAKWIRWRQDLSTVLTDRLFNDPEPDVQAAAADCLGALKLTEAFEDLQQLYLHHF